MTDRAFSRRAFLKTAGVATLGVGLAACQPIPPLGDSEAAVGKITAAQVTDPESLRA